MESLQAKLGFCPQALLFDLDGTLVDSVPDLSVAVDAALSDQGLSHVGEDLVRTWVGNGARQLLLRALSTVQQCQEQQVDPQLLDKTHQCFLRHYAIVSGRYSCLYDGVAEALAKWHQQSIPMALITNKPVQFVPDILNHFSIAHYFSEMVGGDSLPQKKPQPEPLWYVCQQLRVAPESTLMIGDSKNDVEAARAANIPVVCVSYGYNHGEPIEQTAPDLIVDSLMNLCN